MSSIRPIPTYGDDFSHCVDVLELGVLYGGCFEESKIS